MEEHVLICEDSMEGILTGIYEAYQFKKDKGIASHDAIHLAVREPDQCRFFTEYHKIETVHTKAEKVTQTIAKQLGAESWHRLSMAMVSGHEDKADAVYHTIVMGLSMHDKKITDRLQEDCVHRTFECARSSENELCHFKQFLRFSELQNGMLYAKMNAKHHILPFLMPHFADRLPAENFVIYDENTQIFGLHAKYKNGIYCKGKSWMKNSLYILKLNRCIKNCFNSFVTA